MQFTCESCKTVLQIADDKVRGKRLVVRCKRCGAKITISDPALAGKAPAPAAAKPAPAKPAPAPQPKPVEPAPEPEKEERDTDTESTRAMDSDLLERALQASKRDDAAPAPAPAPAPAASQPPPPPPVTVTNFKVPDSLRAPQPATPADPQIWFAMIGGKQTGPMTRGELVERAGQGSVGPRTYLWKEGMASWQRAKDVVELADLFVAPPEPPPPAPPPPAPQASKEHGAGLREFTTSDFGASDLEKTPTGEPAPRAMHEEEDRTSVDPLPLGERVHQEDVAKELFTENSTPGSAADLARWASDELARKSQSNPELPKAAPPVTTPRPPTGPILLSQSEKKPKTTLWIMVVLALIVVGALVVYSMLAPAPAQKPAQPAEQAKTEPAQKPAEPEKPAEPPKAEQKPAEPQQAALTADQVRKKLDENKAALQGCIDEALKREPNLHVGKIHIATTIAPTGSVTAARIDKRTVDESPLGVCLKRATKRIAFPPFSGDSFDVDIPIVVTAGE